ncbi:hypothetical protein KK449_12545 [Clostridioides difficile]|nr:hypothetical protein [Clostridioides difficile]MBT2159380.1 hypothetical protein [Clostridioides difficile]
MLVSRLKKIDINAAIIAIANGIDGLFLESKTVLMRVFLFLYFLLNPSL